MITTLWLQLVRIGFYLLYHQLASIYDAVSWIVSFGNWRRWQMSALPFVEGPDVLELGHGPGHMLLALQRAGYNATGADLSLQMAHLAQKRRSSTGSTFALVQAPAQRLPFASASFDTVIATFPTEFIVHQATLAEVYRVLKNNGRFVILPQARLTGDTLLVRLLESLYRITGQRDIPGTADAQDTRLGLIRQRFREACFDLRLEQVTQPGSEITILIATREDRPE